MAPTDFCAFDIRDIVDLVLHYTSKFNFVEES